MIIWAIDAIDRTGVTESSGDTAPEHAWLSGRYEDPYEGDSKVTETSARLTGDWSPHQWADVFRTVNCI
ncbi:hypothetical protein [Streptomyces sp. NPDC057253]|uniref:hypothetical protein n=1 Tax=Streptomyces sp. NPDC057253 TaxID=3346069 RepID=UPI00362B0590